MKNFKIISYQLAFLAKLLCIANAVSAQDFYYSFGEKIPLTTVSDKFLLLKNQSTSATTILSNAAVSPLATKTILNNNYAAIIQVLPSGNMADIVSKVSSHPSVKHLLPVVKNSLGGEMGLTDQLVVKFKQTTSLSQIDQVVNNYNLVLISSMYNRNVYKLTNPKSILAISNALYETGFAEYSCPDFLVQVQKNAYIPNDPYFGNQINLNNTGQVFNDGHSGTPDADVDAPEAWDITKGSSSIIVAINDEGVSSNHSDLPNTRQVRLNGSNFDAPYDGTNVNDPSPTASNNHGNACAGIVAASQDNSEGVTGIAPNCKIMPIRFPFDGGTSTDIANTIYFATNNGANIISNSWGFTNAYTPNSFPDIIASIQNAIDHNKVVLFAAGNTADANAGNQGFVGYPANINIPLLITVGASDRYDKRANYSPLSDLTSPYNQVVDLVATSHRAYPTQIANETLEMWSIDIPGSAGYNPWNDPDPGWGGFPAVGALLPSSGTNYLSYTGRMGGTSAATPLTAGIAALLLSVNPSLTNQQVYNYLTCSADDVGGYTYTNGFSNEMGNGRVSAFNALMSMCINAISITWPINNQNGIKYQAGQTLTLTNTVATSSNVKLNAGNSIVFNPGVILNSGSVITANIAACSSCVQSSSLRVASNDGASTPLAPSDLSYEISSSRILAHPNPISSGYLNFGYTANSYMFMNSTGAVMLQGSNVDKLDVTGFGKGIYMLKLDNHTQKVVIE